MQMGLWFCNEFWQIKQNKKYIVTNLDEHVSNCENKNNNYKVFKLVIYFIYLPGNLTCITNGQISINKNTCK